MIGELLRVSQSTLLLPQPHHFRHHISTNPTLALPSTTRSYLFSPSPSICAQPQHQLHHNWLLKCTSTTGTTRVEPAFKQPGTEIEPDTSGGGRGGLGSGSDGGGGRGRGGGNNNGGDETKGGSDESDHIKKKGGMSMSQKLTLAYAALVGVGGVMGYLKSGSMKSLAAGGLSALLLGFIYTELPTRPAFASSLGFGISAALLVVMGSRFKKSGKIFPAGVVSFVSLVMSGGYLHGILRSLH